MTQYFTKMIQSLLSNLSSSPELLQLDVETLGEMKKKLRSQGDSASQGSGNQVTDQEACFAITLEMCGFRYASPHVPITENGIYYIYQVNGTQRSIDFQAFVWEDGEKGKAINFDLKHTKSKTFFLNDGWFHENVIYIISWMRTSSEPAIFIGLGQDIPTEEEIALYQEICQIKKKFNTEYKGSSSFHCYIRFANRYDCNHFTTAYTEDRLARVLSFVDDEEDVEMDSDSL